MARSTLIQEGAVRTLWVCTAALALLEGCGGGGDGGNTPERPRPSPNAPPASSTGAATVSWTPPISNEDGSVLTDLAGYRILHGTSRDALDQSIDIANPGLAVYVIENLASGTWYFGVKAYTSTGTESAISNVASKTIQ